MILILTSSYSVIEGMVNITKGIIKSADQIATIVGRNVDDAFVKSLANIASDQSDDMLLAIAKTLKKSATQFDNLTADAVSAAAKKSIDDIAENALKNFTKLEKVGMKNIANMSDDTLTSLGTAKTVGQFSKAIDDLPIAFLDKQVLKNSFKESMGTFTTRRLKSVATDVASNVQKLPGATKKAFTARGLDDVVNGEIELLEAQLKKEGISQAEQKAIKSQIKELYNHANTSAAWRFTKSSGRYFGMTLMGLGAGMGTAVLFMLPTLYQSAYIAEQQHNAMLKTYIPPIKFGNIVMQLPDEAVNMSNPAQSQFVYYGIPVENPGDQLSAKAQAAYPGVSGPTSKNKISAKVHNNLAEIPTFGGAKAIHINRYNLDAQALATLPMFVAYFDNTWVEWGSVGIPDPTFLQKMINLNTGAIFYGDGTTGGTPPANLVGSVAGGQTVQQYISKKYGQLKGTGAAASFAEFRNLLSAGSAEKIGSSMLDQFNCACLTHNNGILSADTVRSCQGSKVSTCLLTTALNQIAGGIALNAAGKVLQAGQDLAAEVAQGALGQIIPIQGLDAQFDNFLKMFPGAEQQALKNSGALTVNVSNSGDGSAIVQGAPADNYAAQGVYVYQCNNTPLAKMLRSQAGGSASYSNLISDYIVFLDQNLNQVPLMTPQQDPNNFHFITMGLNPAIQYFSTIFGVLSSGASGNNFSFLPQSEVQTPAALIAKGLPASFTPLYGLRANNGSLSINYNRNLSATIGAIAQTLMNHPKLGTQFNIIQSAIQELLNAGPFGKYNLLPLDSALQPVINDVSLALYSGYNAYPVPQGDSNASCSDILIPLSNSGQTATLPSSSIAQYYGLVSDLTYSIKPDGTMYVDPAKGFVHSPISSSLEINQSQVSDFYWMSKLTAMAQQNNPDFVMPEGLIDMITQARAAWIAWIQENGQGAAAKQFTGASLPASSLQLKIADQQAMENGLYVYTCSPNPSSLAQDIFVIVNSTSPQISSSDFGTISVTKGLSSSNLLSIVSGQLYSAKGVALSAAALNSQAILQTLKAKFPEAFSASFVAQLNAAASVASVANQALLYPYPFGKLQLGIYQVDKNAGNYLYVSAAGAGASADFIPQDYFITIDSYTNPGKVAMALASTTQYVVSLVSGNVYNAQGQIATLPAKQLAALIQVQSGKWRSGIVQQIAALAAQSAAITKDRQEETKQMNAVPAGNAGAVMVDQSAIAAMISGMAATSFLPAPYDKLKQDPASGAYALVSPANEEGSEFVYMFFDLKNSFVDDAGKAIRVGAIYNEQAQLLQVVKGSMLENMLRQQGVIVDNSGKQYLGVQSQVPMMQIDSVDMNLKPGFSGKSMIYSNDPQFPSVGLVSPIAYQGSKFYIYYNMLMNAYFAMQVTGSVIRYIDIAGGAVYNANGSPLLQTNPVAVNDKNDLLLPYMDAYGFVSYLAKNSNNNNAYSDFMNYDFSITNDPASNNIAGVGSFFSQDVDASSLQVSQMPFPAAATSMPDIATFNQYAVYKDDQTTPDMYTKNAQFSWQKLQLLPLNMASGTIMSSLPDAQYNAAAMIMKNNVITNVIFAGQMYNAKQTGTNFYTLTSNAGQATVAIKTDAKTKMQYVEVVAGGVTYAYQFLCTMLSSSQLSDYATDAWNAGIAASTVGNVVLEKNLPVDVSGNIIVAPVTAKSVINLPANSQSVMAGLSNVMQDVPTGRFFVVIPDGTYAALSGTCYVNLSNGILFDSTGTVMSISLAYQDLQSLLAQLSVVVVKNNNNNQFALKYVVASTTAQNGSSVSAVKQGRSNLLGRLTSAEQNNATKQKIKKAKKVKNRRS